MTDEKDAPRRDPRAARNQRQQRAAGLEAEAATAPSAEKALVQRADPRRLRNERRQPVSEQPLAPTSEVAPAIPRRDPRAGTRSRATALAGTAAPTTAAGPAVTRIEAPATWCLVVPDAREGALSSHDRDVLAAARQVADQRRGGVIAFAPREAADYSAYGVDRLVPREAGDGFAPERALAVLTALVRAYTPMHVFLPESLTGGGHLGRLLAARLGEAVATNVIRLSASEAIRRCDGGRTEETLALPRIVLLAPEAATPRFTDKREARLLTVSADPQPERIGDGGRLALDASDMPLAESDFIVSAGVGVTEWPRFLAVARALQATVGCTRAVCDAGHLPRNRQVGASGTLVDPRCYLCFGISGAPQHLQGIARCERVIAVNTDLHAEMIKRAHLAIVADAQPVMASLLDLLEAPR